MDLLTFLCIVSAGALSHWAFFIRGEHHLHAGLFLHMFLIAVLTCLLLESLARLNKSSCCSGIAVLFVYLGGLFSSVIIYRLFFNGLKRFPGSWWARISKFWHFYHVLDAKKCLLLEELRLSYGDIVRTGEWNVMSTWTTHLSDTGTGPNEITIYCPEALTPVHAYGLQCKKSAWYDMLTPFTAMNTTRSKTEHDKRRRAYESGLSVKGGSPPCRGSPHAEGAISCSRVSQSCPAACQGSFKCYRTLDRRNRQHHHLDAILRFRCYGRAWVREGFQSGQERAFPLRDRIPAPWHVDVGMGHSSTMALSSGACTSRYPRTDQELAGSVGLVCGAS